MAINTDYSNLMNQQRLNNNKAIFGNAPSIAGIPGNVIQDWSMLRSNSAAYRKLLEAEKTGSIKKPQTQPELLSDKYFNENYDAKNKKLIKPTYKPISKIAEEEKKPETTPPADGTGKNEAAAGETAKDEAATNAAAADQSDKTETTVREENEASDKTAAAADATQPNIDVEA